MTFITGPLRIVEYDINTSPVAPGFYGGSGMPSTGSASASVLFNFTQSQTSPFIVPHPQFFSVATINLSRDGISFYFKNSTSSGITLRSAAPGETWPTASTPATISLNPSLPPTTALFDGSLTYIIGPGSWVWIFAKGGPAVNPIAWGIISPNGTSGSSGYNGTSGSSGTNGINGTSGSSGTDGTNGTSGSSGTDGTNGTSGSSGVDGTFFGSSGSSGVDGTSGSSGLLPGIGNNYEVLYRDTSATYGYNTSTGLTYDGNTLTASNAEINPLSQRNIVQKLTGVTINNISPSVILTINNITIDGVAYIDYWIKNEGGSGNGRGGLMTLAWDVIQNSAGVSEYSSTDFNSASYFNFFANFNGNSIELSAIIFNPYLADNTTEYYTLFTNMRIVNAMT